MSPDAGFQHTKVSVTLYLFYLFIFIYLKSLEREREVIGPSHPKCPQHRGLSRDRVGEVGDHLCEVGTQVLPGMCGSRSLELEAEPRRGRRHSRLGCRHSKQGLNTCPYPFVYFKRKPDIDGLTYAEVAVTHPGLMFVWHNFIVSRSVTEMSISAASICSFHVQQRLTVFCIPGPCCAPAWILSIPWCLGGTWRVERLALCPVES